MRRLDEILEREEAGQDDPDDLGWLLRRVIKLETALAMAPDVIQAMHAVWDGQDIPASHLLQQAKSQIDGWVSRALGEG